MVDVGASGGRRPRRLAGDQEGAILVIGLVSAVFLTALLYFVFGIGETIRHHERMNDAVDSGAYATGVMHARAMNLAALGNMLKLTVASVQAAYLAIATGATLLILWIASGSWKRWARYGYLVGFAAYIIATAMSSYSGFRSKGKRITNAVDDLQATLRDDLPTIALLKADRIVADNYQEPALGLVSAPDMSHELDPMPIRRGSAFDLCVRAFPYVAGMIVKASRDLPEKRGRFIRYAMPTGLPYCLGQGIRPYEMSDSQLGGESFQIRVAAYGNSLPALGERGVMIGTYLMDEPTSKPIAARRDRLSVLTLAQSEYYFDGPQDADEMLWQMKWKARMRRFRLSGGSGNLGGVLGADVGGVYR